MIKNRSLKYISLVLFTIIFTLILLEVALRLSGQYLLWSRRKAQYDGTDIIRVACVGDSHTFGVGTSMQYSYPEQLERLLNDNNPPQRFSVINLGKPGASPRFQFEELKNFFDNNTADLVILLTGRNYNIDLETWEMAPSPRDIKYTILNLRSIKFLKEILNYTTKKDVSSPDIRKTARNKRKEIYDNYMYYCLDKIRILCLDKGGKLVLVSYYNSSHKPIEKFAETHGIPYFNFTESFEMLFERDDRTRYISPDESHMNHRGNGFFAEQVYEQLFLSQGYIGFKMNPLLRKIRDRGFYTSASEIKEAIEFAKMRIKKNRNDPYELIHLGHIYMEMGKYESARKFYMTALVSSDYINDNTITSPIINWYLREGGKENAVRICEDILLHNPGNAIARHYYDTLSPDTPGL